MSTEDEIVRDFPAKVAAMSQKKIKGDLANYDRLVNTPNWWALDPGQRDRLSAMANVLRDAVTPESIEVANG